MKIETLEPKKNSSPKQDLPKDAGRTEKEKEVLTMARVTANFLADTTAHGLKKVLISKTAHRRFAWIVMFLVSLAFLAYQTYTVVIAYKNYEISVKTIVDQSPAVLFPAVTVCNMNMLKKSRIGNSKYSSLATIDTQAEAGVCAKYPASCAEYDPYYKQNFGSPYPQTMGGANNTDQNATGHQPAPEPPPNGFLWDGGISTMYPPAPKPPPSPPPDEGKWGMGISFSNFTFVNNGMMDVSNQFDFEAFMKLSKTSDYSDLINLLRPSSDDLLQYGTRIEDFILQCSFDQDNCTTSDFALMQNSFYGNCFTFNSGINPNWVVRNTSEYGSSYGLRLTLNIDYDNYVGLFSQSSGVIVTAHPNNVHPFPEDDGLYAAPGMSTEIAVSVEVIQREPSPYPSNCTDGQDIPMKFPGLYTVTACIVTCIQNKLEENCGCVDEVTTSTEKPRCCAANYTQEECSQRVYYLHQTNQLNCNCPPACNEITYEASVSSAKWPSNPYMYILANDLVDRPGIMSLLNTDNFIDSVQKNLVRVHIYMVDLRTHLMLEYPAYPWDRLVADLGGLLALYLGFSVLTAVEIVEYIYDMIMLMGRNRAARPNIVRSGSTDQSPPVLDQSKVVQRVKFWPPPYEYKSSQLATVSI